MVIKDKDKALKLLAKSNFQFAEYSGQIIIKGRLTKQALKALLFLWDEL